MNNNRKNDSIIIIVNKESRATLDRNYPVFDNEYSMLASKLIKLYGFEGKNVVVISVEEYLSNQFCKKGFDVGILLFWEGIIGELENYTKQLSNVETMINVIRKSKELEIERLLYIGSIVQLETRVQSGEILDKNRYYRIAREYVKIVGEKESNSLGIEFSCIIPGYVYGENEESNRFLTVLLNKLKLGQNMKTSKGNQLYDFVHVNDVAKDIVKISEDSILKDEYYIGSGNPKPLKEWIESIPDWISSKGEILFGEIEYKGVFLDIKDFSASYFYGGGERIPFKDGILRVYETIGGGIDEKCNNIWGRRFYR